ncbi:MAG: guanine deaminase [Candidatus Margulisiibacteriota bacterium]
MAISHSVERVIVGNFVHALGPNQLQWLPNGVIALTAAGTIAAVAVYQDKIPFKQIEATFGISSDAIIDHSACLTLPGFIDAHTHPSQYGFCGTHHGVPLLDWLSTKTYPEEAHFRDVNHAKTVYKKAVARFLSCGTTTAVYCPTRHKKATLALCEIVQDAGQRAYIGKINMDCRSPQALQETTETSLAETEEVLQDMTHYPLAFPILSPRFAGACTPDLMAKLGLLAKTHSLPIQTHLAENQDEVAWMKTIFPQAKHYTDIYAQAGLLTPKTLLAHGIYLGDDELHLIAEAGSSIVHCPNSNASLRSGSLNVRRVLDAGITVALGTDVAGGYSPSMLDALRNALATSQLTSPENPLTLSEAFYLATLGGAKALGMDHYLGNFRLRKAFDAIVINPWKPNAPFDVFAGDTWKTLFEKYLLMGDDRCHEAVFVQGKQVL